MRKPSLLFCLGFSVFLSVVAQAQEVTAPAAQPAPQVPPAPAGTAAEFKAGPQAGQKVAFLGDSITAYGWGPTGYVQLVVMAMEKQGRKIEAIPAGVSGNTSKDMLARLDRDVISKKPDWMTLSCGVNDVWHGAGGVPLDDYKKNITEIVDKATAAGIRVVILTSTLIMEDPTNEFNQKQVAYNDFLHSLALERGLPVAELNADEQAELTKMKTDMPDIKGPRLTVDGVHMNGMGNETMAAGILKAFGSSDDQIAQAKTAWLELPGAMATVPKGGLSVTQYLHLQALAQSQGKTVDDLVNEAWKKDLDAFQNTPVPPHVPAGTAAASTNAASGNP